MIKITMQKNVLVFTDTRGYTFTHKAFVKWLSTENITEFVFRPSDPENTALVKRRTNVIKKLGYNVSKSDSVHHYLFANKP